MQGAEAHPNAVQCCFWSRSDARATLQHFAPDASVHYPPHSHPEYNAVVCLAGAVSVTQLGVTETLQPGEALIGNRAIEHSSSYIKLDGSCQAISLTFAPQHFENLIERLSLRRRYPGRGAVFYGKAGGESLLSTAMSIRSEIRQEGLGRDLVLEGLADRLLVELLRAWPSTAVERRQLDEEPRLPRREFVRAYELMRLCAKKDFRLGALAHRLGTSLERFSRLFRTATGTTPAAFYNLVLLDRGRLLLQRRHLSVKEISFLLGFKTCSHFSAAFRRQFALTPSEYRAALSGWSPVDEREVPTRKPVATTAGFLLAPLTRYPVPPSG